MLSLFDHDENRNALRSLLKDLPERYDAVQEDGWRLLGLLFNSYLLVEDGLALSIIDFHAAHERIIYDVLMRGSIPVDRAESAFEHDSGRAVKLTLLCRHTESR